MLRQAFGPGVAGAVVAVSPTAQAATSARRDFFKRSLEISQGDRKHGNVVKPGEALKKCFPDGSSIEADDGETMALDGIEAVTIERHGKRLSQ